MGRPPPRKSKLTAFRMKTLSIYPGEVPSICKNYFVGYIGV